MSIPPASIVLFYRLVIGINAFPVEFDSSFIDNIIVVTKRVGMSSVI